MSQSDRIKEEYSNAMFSVNNLFKSYSISEKKEKFKNVASTQFHPLYKEIQDLKKEIESDDLEFQIAMQKIRRFKTLSKDLIRKVAIRMIGMR